MLANNHQPLSFIDNFWLRQDRPYNHMTISSVFILKEQIDLEKLKATIETRWAAPYIRLRQRPVYSLKGAYWETDPHFDIDNHFRRLGLPGAQDKQALEECVSNLVSTPMDPTKPLWDWNLVENYQGGSALILRIHHCYADGIAMIHLVLAMTDKTPEAPIHSERPDPPAPSRQGHQRDDIFTQLFHPVSETIKAGQGLWEGGVDALSHPSETMGHARRGLGTVSGYANQGLGLVSEAAGLLMIPDEPRTGFKGKLGIAKRVAWVDPLPLNEVKTIGKVHGCTINDVLLATVAGALRGYLVGKGDEVDGQLEIRAAVPVNLRPLDRAKDLGNRFGTVLLTLPVGIENSLERLRAVHESMEKIRASYQAVVTFGLMEIMGLGPQIAQASAMRLLSKKATAVMTNVPGPEQPLYFAGSKLDQMMFWVPQSGSVGMGVSIISYNNRVHFGLVTDQKLVKDPETIISQFNSEFERLLLITLMGSWQEQATRLPPI